MNDVIIQSKLQNTEDNYYIKIDIFEEAPTSNKMCPIQTKHTKRISYELIPFINQLNKDSKLLKTYKQIISAQPKNCDHRKSFNPCTLNINKIIKKVFDETASEASQEKSKVESMNNMKISSILKESTNKNAIKNSNIESKNQCASKEETERSIVKEKKRYCLWRRLACCFA